MAIKALNSVAGFSVGETPANIILANGDITTTNITTTGVSNLNSVGNVKITGGTGGQVISTDGAGNLSFITVSTAGLSNGTSNIAILNNGNITFSVAGNANIATVTGTGMVIAGTLSTGTGVITGNGSGLTSLTGANVTGTVANATFATTAGSATTADSATTAGTVTTNAQPNITSVGTLTALAVTGNASAGNLNTAGAVVASTLTSNVATGTAPFVVTSTTQVANLSVATAGTATTAGSATTAGTVTTNAQPNITSTGTLTSLSVTGTATAGNLSTGGTLSATGNANVGNLGTAGLIAATGNVTGGNLVTAGAVFAPNLVQNASTYDTRISLGSSSGVIAITSDGNSTQFRPSGQIELSGASQIVGGTFAGSGITLGASQTDIFQNRGGNVTVQVGAGGTIANTWTFGQDGSFTSPGAVSATGNVSGGNITTGGVVAATGNVSGGNITTGGVVAATGNVSGGNLTTGGIVNATGNIVSGANVVTDLIVGKTSSVTITATGTDQNVNLVPTGTGSVNVGNFIISNVATPVASTDAATKQYVDDIAQGLHTHDSCNAATSTTLATSSGGTVTYNNGTSGVGATLTTTGSYTTIDGVTLSNGMRILVKNEANAAHNGIYDRTSTTVLTRSTDFDTPTEMAGGDFTFVSAGTLYDNTGWVMPDPVTTVGTTDVVWVQFSGAGTYTAGTGLALNGNQFSIANTTVTAGSYGNGDYNATFTVNEQGQLSAAANVAITANAANLTGTTLAATIVNSSLTSVGTLTALAVTGNVTAGNVYANSGTIGASLLAGTLTTAAQPNITSVGTLGSLSVTNKITAGQLQGDGGNISNIQGANVSGAVSSATTAGTVTTNAQPNITSTGTLTSLSVTGNVSTGNISGTNGNLTTANVSGSVILGNASVTTRIIWASATTTAITANQTIATFSATGVTGVEFLVKGVDATGTKYSVATVQAVTDGTNVDYSTFGTVNLGGFTGALAVNISGGNVVLQVTPASSNSTVWTTQYRLI